MRRNLKIAGVCLLPARQASGRGVDPELWRNAGAAALQESGQEEARNLLVELGGRDLAGFVIPEFDPVQHADEQECGNAAIDVTIACLDLPQNGFDEFQ